ncbi:glycosyltransferase family 2 protein [Paenibacillus faecalis]|uniref:glycosyltransferase family 2 protein n=1 Tax=Paenibacillus faecalis TaxID=2079532 RepID=UPI000D0FFAD5|nr:glycosyltransferase family 2 protein [Paenibacillus faecalis]
MTDGLTSIVVLTKDRLDLTKRCVESVIRNTEISFEWIFVDNASKDNTIEYLQTVENAKVIQNSENKGFAAGCNQGMAVAKGKYIVLLNNDTIVTPGWLSNLHKWLKKIPSAGIVGPVSNVVAPIQRVNDFVYQSLEELNAYAEKRAELFKDKGFYPHRLTGLCMLFPVELVNRIGGMDERFFPGNYEDDDFCIRARISGYTLWVAQDVFIYHEGHGTFGGRDISYKLSSLQNAEKFRQKWSIGQSAFEIDQLGYNPSDIVAREMHFIPSRHVEKI